MSPGALDYKLTYCTDSSAVVFRHLPLTSCSFDTLVPSSYYEKLDISSL